MFYFDQLEKIYIIGKHLNNRLTDWDCTQNPVIVVYRSEQAVVAIELSVKEIWQAFRKNNQDIETNSSLHKSIVKWFRKYNIKMFCEN